jgi:alkyl hydroperoxide reductase subunit D
MPLAALLAALPASAADVSRSFAACWVDDALGAERKWGCALAASEALALEPLSHAIGAEAPLGPDMRAAIQGVAAVMAMNNVYFRAVHLMSSREYSAMRAGLRMRALVASGVPAGDVDLWAIAVSAINGCGVCLDDHATKFRAAGGTAASVQAAIRLAAALAGLAAALRATAARAL